MCIFKKRDKSCLDTRVLGRLRLEAELKVYLEFSRDRCVMRLCTPSGKTSLYHSKKHWRTSLLTERRKYISNKLYNLKVERSWKINESICDKMNNERL